MKIVTEELFEQLVGCKPIEDDLERCNCEKAGSVGHQSCGWNAETNLPVFMGSMAQPMADIHAATAAKMFNVDIANVTYEQRQAGKKANFSALYK